MSIKDILTAPRYGIYLPNAKTTTNVEYTSYGANGFKISATLDINGTEPYVKLKNTLNDYLAKSKKYLAEKDLGLLSVMLDGAAKGASYVIDFGTEGITLASAISIKAERLSLIYEKYNDKEYALQLALTKQSSIMFFKKVKLNGDFYLNIKRSEKEDITTISGYCQFHLGNEKAAKPVILSAGVIKRLPIVAPSKDATTDDTKEIAQKPTTKVDHTFIQVQSRDSRGITIADIVRMVTPDTVAIPDALDKVAIYDFAVLKTTGENENSLAIVLDCSIKINEKSLKTRLTILSETTTTKKDGNDVVTKTFRFIGKLSLDQHRFDIEFNKNSDGWAIIAQYDSGKTITEIEFKKLAVQLFGKDVEDVVPDLKLKIQNFKAFFYYKKQEKGGKILLGLGAGIDVDLKKIPLAGDILVEMKAIQFKEVLAMYSKGVFTDKELAQIKGLPKGFKQKAGLSISAEVAINGESKYYTLGGGNDTTKNDEITDTKPKAQEDTSKPAVEGKEVKKQESLDSSIASKASWSQIDKKIGPVNLQRFGLAYHQGKIVALLDASIEMKGMSMQMMGLGVGFKLDWNKLEPDFYLDGLGMSYKTDSIEISGAFLRGNSNGIETYNGAARLKMKNFTISALGSYAKVNNESSLFIYGLYEGNIGGPSFFYVTAIAAGFGYNRKINAPEIDEVANFPLVALAMQPEQKDLHDVLISLEQPMKSGKLPIEISAGNYWLALGIKFTSFKIIESFLLATVNFGTKTEFNILGLSRLSWPEKAIREKTGLADPIVFVELAIKASFGPDSDVIKVDGLISPNSYVFSKDCKLSGGFAFYTWVAGEHAGDFVVTIGGYHPRFPKPAHYPTVPRVALNWKFNEQLQLKGELYFALTPSAIMMGGRWELLYTSSDVKAAFIMWIDILMQWAPFYYEIEIGIIIRIEANVSLLLCTVHLNVEIRAQLQIWGPPFSGIARIDLNVYSFEIQFGSKELPSKKSLEWDQFATTFLPIEKEKLETPKEEKKPEQNEKRVLKSTRNKNSEATQTTQAKATNTVNVGGITATISEGVIQIIEQPKEEKIYIANPQEVKIDIDSSIPVKDLTFNGQTVKQETTATIGIKPCGIKSSEVSFEMNVTVTLNKENVPGFTLKEITKNFPEALWGEPEEDSKDKEPKEPKLIKAMSGLSLSPKPLKPNYSQNFDFSTFVEEQKRTENITTPTLKPEQPFNTSDVYENMKNEYKGTKQTRDTIMIALSDFGFDKNEFAEFAAVEAIYDDPSNFFRGTPKVGTIGNEVYNPKDTN